MLNETDPLSDLYLLLLRELAGWAGHVGGRIEDLRDGVVGLLLTGTVLIYVIRDDYTTTWTYGYRAGCSSCSTLLLLVVLLSVNKEMSSAVVDFKQFPIFLIQASMAEQQLEGGETIESYCIVV